VKKEKNIGLCKGTCEGCPDRIFCEQTETPYVAKNAQPIPASSVKSFQTELKVVTPEQGASQR